MNPVGLPVAPVVAAVAAYGLPGTTLDLPDRPVPAPDWARLLRQVVAERLIGLLTAAVEQGSFPVTDDQRQQVEEEHVAAMVRALVLERTALEALAALRAAGIDCRLLKGSAVAHLDYPDPALRPFGDIDLLLRGAQFEEAVRALEILGVRQLMMEPRSGFAARFGKGVTLSTRDGTEIDLHRTLAHGSYGFTVPLDELWESPSILHLAGCEVPALGPEDRLMHAAYHAVLGTRPAPLLPARDVAEVALFGQHDDRALLDRARQWRAEAVLARAITEAWATLEITDVTFLSRWAERRTLSMAEQRQLNAYDRMGNPYAARAINALPYVPGLRAKVAFAHSLALPAREFLASRSQTRRSWLARGLRAARAGSAPDHA